MRFDGRGIIVTGGCSGIGRAVTDVFTERGGTVAIVDINRARLDTAVEELSAFGVFGCCVDLSKTRETQEALASAAVSLGRVDILVNCAGIPSLSPFEALGEEEWDRVIAANLKSVFNTCRAVLPDMRRRGYGRIVNIASVAGKRGGGIRSTSAYAAAKGGVIALTKSLAREYGAYGITCNAVCPASIPTPFNTDFTGEAERRYIQTVPLKRRGTAREVANMVAFLASELASYVTGEISDVDGGVMMD